MLYKALHNVNMQTYRDACIHSTTRTYSVRYTSHYRKTTVSPIILNQLLLSTNFTNSTRSLRTCELSYQPSCRADNTQCMHGCHPKWFSRLSLFWFKKQSWSQAPYTFFFFDFREERGAKGEHTTCKGNMVLRNCYSVFKPSFSLTGALYVTSHVHWHLYIYLITQVSLIL